MNINDKLVLWHTEKRSNAYFDQYGFPHSAQVLLEEIPVIVIELKDVAAAFGEEKKHKGIKVQAKDGRKFINSWNYFSIDSPIRRVYWREDNGDKGGIEMMDASYADYLGLVVDKNGIKVECPK